MKLKDLHSNFPKVEKVNTSDPLVEKVKQMAVNKKIKEIGNMEVNKREIWDKLFGDA